MRCGFVEVFVRPAARLDFRGEAYAYDGERMIRQKTNE